MLESSLKFCKHALNADLRTYMKTLDKQFAAFGMLLAAAGLFIFPHAALATGANDTVSAIGSPVTPMPTPVPSTPESVMPTNVPATPTTSAVVPYATPKPLPPSVAVPPPAQQGLMPGVSPVPQEASGVASGANVMGDTGVRPKHSGTYYDSNAIVPDSALANAGITGMRKVDPALEPGQKYIVVEKGASASSYEAQYTAATRALKLGRYAAAMEMFEKLRSKNSRDIRVLMGLAVAQQGAGFDETARETYEDLLKVQPNNADAIVNLMGIMKNQYPEITLTKLRELRNKYPNNAGIPAQLGLVNAGLKNYDDAIRYLEVAASMEPHNPSHVYNMAIVEDRKGRIKNAITLYERALQMDASYGDAATSLPREEIYDRLVTLRRKA